MRIFHGDNQIASRQKFLSAKHAARANFQLAEIPAAEADLASVSSALATPSLLGQPVLVCLEGLFSRPASTAKSRLLTYLSQHPNLPVLIWESKDISSQLVSFPSAVVVNCPLPKYLYNFLDSFSIVAYHQALKLSSPEAILAMLARRVGDLLKFSDHLSDFPAWQRAKLKPLLAKFPPARLLEFNQRLLATDYRYKTSTLALPLETALEQVLIWLNQSQRS